MFGLQPTHIVILFLAAVIFFAPSRLPLLGRGAARMISEFRKEISSKPRPDATDDSTPADSPKPNGRSRQ